MTDTTELVRKGVSLPELLTAIVPARKTASTAIVAQPPKHIVRTGEVEGALNELAELDLVHVDEVRQLTSAEKVALMRERVLLDTLAAFIEKRKAVMKKAVYNHLDIEAAGDDEALRDKDGHLVKAGRVEVPELALAFTREERAGQPHVTAEGLEAVLDHDDYLECTTPVRVVDEAKIMLKVRKDPNIVAKLAEAVVPGEATTAFNKRKL